MRSHENGSSGLRESNDTNLAVRAELPGQCGSRRDTRSKEIAQGAHNYATDNEPRPSDIYDTKPGKIPRSPVNHGVTWRRDAGDTRTTKAEVLGDAIVDPLPPAQDSGPSEV